MLGNLPSSYPSVHASTVTKADTPTFSFGCYRFHTVIKEIIKWGNIISSHKRLWKCHSHYFNDQNIHLFPEGFAFISCKYLHFIFLENLRTKYMKIPEGINGYFYIRKLLHFNGNEYFL